MQSGRCKSSFLAGVGKLKEEQNWLSEQPEMVLHVLNHIRHDWLNHLQVLFTFFRLGRTDEGISYIKRVTEEMKLESAVARLNSPLLSVFLLTFPAFHSDLRLDLEIEEGTDLSRVNVPQTILYEWFSQLVFTVQKGYEKGEEVRESLGISFAPDEQGVLVSFDLGVPLSASAKGEVDNLVEMIGAGGAIVLEHIHTEEEWVLRLHFPYG